MSRWYWSALACAALFVFSWLMPAYVTEDGGAVWSWEIGRGANWRDADDNPLHNDRGDRIKPNWVRSAALLVFGPGTVGLAGAAYLCPRKRRRLAPSTAQRVP
jgi:hypothetical protein